MAKSHMRRCIGSLILESQLPHKIVNLLYSKPIVNNKLMILWRIYFLKPLNQYIVSDIIEGGPACQGRGWGSEGVGCGGLGVAELTF